MKKKKTVILTIIIILIVISIILISPSIINKSKGSLGEIVPANSAFDDINFYTCVTSSLSSNEENDMEIYSEIYDMYQGNLSEEKYYEKYNVNLTDEQLASITNLDCSYVKSTKGIEKLTSLNNLSIYDSSITSIDLSKNTNLINLDINHNPNLTSIDLNKNLSSLKIYNSNLKSIDLSKNSNLTNLDIRYNPNLTSIDLNKNKNLSSLEIYNSNLKSIDLSKNSNLINLDIRYNYNLTSIDLNETLNQIKLVITGNPNLTSIDLSNINITSYDISYNGLKSIIAPANSSNYIKTSDLYQYNYIKSYEFSNNKKINIVSDDISINQNVIIIKEEMSKENFKNGLGLSNITIKLFDKYYSRTESTSDIVKDGLYIGFYNDSNTELGKFQIKQFNNPYFEDYNLYKLVIDAYNSTTGSNYTIKNNLTEEEFSKVTSIIRNSGYNFIFSIKGIEKLTNLNSLYLLGNGSITIDVNNLTNLTSLKLGNFNLNNMDLSNLNFLEELDLADDNITNITLPKSNNLLSINLYNNKLKTLDVSGLTRLQSLKLYHNEIEEIIGLEELTNLSLLDVNGNKLKKLDLSNLNSLEELDLANNNITNITLPKSNNLLSIDLSDNKLNKLDVFGLTGLQTLMLDNNEIEEIKGLSGINNLYGISVVNNRLKKLDLSNMSNLEIYYIYNNPCTISDVSIIKGDKIEYNPAFKLPPTIFLKTYNEYDDVISFNDGIITGLEVGESTISSFIPTNDEYTPIDIPIRYKVYVYDVLSSKYTVNKEHRYIYVGTENNDKAIKRYVKVYGEDASKKVENNKFKLLRNDELIEEFDIIKLTSSKYDLSSSVISYKGDFDINNIKVTNGKIQVIEDQLQVIYDDVIVKSFTLKEEK